MIKIERLHPMGKTLTGEDQLVQLFDNRHFNRVRFAVTAGVFIVCAKEIGIKHAGHTVFAQQD
ncbi:hypothetical protein D3C86_1954140 [compost metagenome]